MPRFFFDLRDKDGALEQDEVGIDLPDFETAYLIETQSMHRRHRDQLKHFITLAI